MPRATIRACCAPQLLGSDRVRARRWWSGAKSDVKAKLEAAGLGDAVRELTVVNSVNSRHIETYRDFVYKRLQRQGFDREDAYKLANRDRHVFAALMLAHGHGDGMVTGATRKGAHVLAMINHVFDAKASDGAVGITAVLHKGRIVLIGDTLVHEWPDENDLADIAERGAHVARGLGLEPRVAFLSFSNFGYPVSERATKMYEAAKVLDRRGVDFEYEGEMTVDVALNAEQMANYPFCRLTGPANVLVVPARHSASISVKLMQEMAGATVIGPILTGRRETNSDLFHGLDGERYSEHGSNRGLQAGARPLRRAGGFAPPDPRGIFCKEEGRAKAMTIWNLGSINIDHFYRLAAPARARRNAGRGRVCDGARWARARTSRLRRRGPGARLCTLAASGLRAGRWSG